MTNHNCVIMVEYIYMSAQEEDDAGIAGVLMGGSNIYSSGLFQLLTRGQKQKILYLFSSPGVTKLTLMLFIRGNNWANLYVLLK